MIKKLTRIFNIYFLIALIPYISGLGIAIFLNLVPIIPGNENRIASGLCFGLLWFWSIGSTILFVEWLLKPSSFIKGFTMNIFDFITKLILSAFLFSLSFLLSILLSSLNIGLTSEKSNFDWIVKIIFQIFQIGQFIPLLLLPRLYEDYQKSKNKYQKFVNVKNQEKINLLQEKIKKEKKQKSLTQQQYESTNLKLQEWQKKTQDARQNGNELLDEYLKQQTFYADFIFELQVKLEEINIRLNELNQELDKIKILT